MITFLKILQEYTEMGIDIINNIWPDWKIIGQIGEGSFGKVYKVVRNEHDITSMSAVKVISIPQNDAELASIRAEGLDESGTRSYFKDIVTDFVNEIKLMESMKGTSNVVNIEDYKVVEKTDKIGWDIFIRMELLTPLTDYTANKKLSEAEVIKLGQDICSALELCSRQKIIHRDIKPENIFISSNGNFKVGDFGVARKLEKSNYSLSRKGSPNYIAPEIENSKEYDATVDIYSLGLVLYRLLNNNRLPFFDPSAQFIQYNERKSAIDRRLRGEQFPMPINASIDMVKIIFTACAFNPSDRFQSPTAFKNALGSIRENNLASEKQPKKPVKIRKPVFVIITTFIALAAVCLLAWFILRDNKPNTADGLNANDSDEVMFAQENADMPKSHLSSTSPGDETDTVIIAVDADIIAAGGANSYAIKEDGSLWAWGNNAFGQVGDGTRTDQSSPIKIMDSVVSVSTSSIFHWHDEQAHTLAIKTDGSLWAWGSNGYGQLGDGANIDNPSPVKIMDDTIAVSAGASHSMAISSDGSLWAWGSWSLTGSTVRSRQSRTKIMNDVIAISAGEVHSLALQNDGSLWTWGDNSNGQLGYDKDVFNASPVKIMDDVIAISAGAYHNLAIKKDGSLWVWGSNSTGQLGNSTMIQITSPVKIMDDIVDISAGFSHSLAVTGNGELLTWGFSFPNITGNENNGPDPVHVIDGVVKVSAGMNHSMALKSDGSLWAWGYNNFGQIGDGTVTIIDWGDHDIVEEIIEDNSRVSPVKIMDGVKVPGNNVNENQENNVNNDVWMQLYFDEIQDALVYADSNDWGIHDQDGRYPLSPEAFILIDLNFDGIPELIISGDVTGVDTPQYRIFTISGDRVEKIFLGYGLPPDSIYGDIYDAPTLYSELFGWKLYRKISDGSMAYAVLDGGRFGHYYTGGDILLTNQTTVMDTNFLENTKIADFQILHDIDTFEPSFYFNEQEVDELEIVRMLNDLLSDYEAVNHIPAILWSDYRGDIITGDSIQMFLNSYTTVSKN